MDTNKKYSYYFNLSVLFAAAKPVLLSGVGFCILTSLLLVHGAPANYGAEKFISSKRLNLLCKDQARRIYQIKSISHLDGYSCGYFVLHNSRMLESLIGLNSSCDIKSVCSQYINSKNLNPRASLNTTDLVHMADNNLSLKNFYILNLAPPNQIKLQLNNYSWQPYFSTKYKTITAEVTLKKHDAHVKIKAPYRTSEDNIKVFVMDSLLAKLHEKLLSLKSLLYTNSAAIINFACILSSENHYILVSVLKLPNENPALFVLDNMNLRFNSSPERTSFINGIYNIFCV